MVSPPWGQCLLGPSQTPKTSSYLRLQPVLLGVPSSCPSKGSPPASTAALSPLSSIRLALPVFCLLHPGSSSTLTYV